MKLNEIQKSDYKNHKKKRVGRGIGSGTGKTSGKGHKGQKSRSGVSIKGFEGGQMPIHRRLPKRGFRNIFRIEYSTINLGIIQKLIDEKKIKTGKILDADVFVKSGLLKNKNKKYKILAKGILKDKIEIQATKFSNNAKAMIEKNGGKASISEFSRTKVNKIESEQPKASK